MTAHLQVAWPRHRPARVRSTLRGPLPCQAGASLGTQSERGERLERLLSASITCRLRKQSLFAYLTQVITAHARGDPTPALS